MLSAMSGKVSSRFTLYLTIQVSSVLVPGMVLGTEIALLIISGGAHGARASLSSFLAAMSGLHGATMVFVFILALATCYIVGYICREFTFWFVGILEQAKRRLSGAQDSGHPLLDRIKAVVGEDAIAECADFHPVIGSLVRGAELVSPALTRTGGGAHRQDFELEVFVYAKLWLRRFSPTLAVDQMEAEINILVATLLPVILAVPVAAAWGGDLLLVLPLGLPLALFGCYITVTSAMRLRRSERWEAIRNMFEDHLMRMAAARYEAELAPALAPAAPPAASSAAPDASPAHADKAATTDNAPHPG